MRKYLNSKRTDKWLNFIRFCFSKICNEYFFENNNIIIPFFFPNIVYIYSKMPRVNLAAGATWHSKAKSGSLDIAQKVMSGGVPASLLGETPRGGSMFANIAHRVEQMKRIDNLVNNGVDQELYFTVVDKNNKPINTPFKIGDKQYFPNPEGKVRVANASNVKLAKEIRDYQEEKTDKLMSLFILGDDVAAYVIGVSSSEWDKMCAPNGKPVGDTRTWDPDMLKLKCSIDYIESLPDGSLTQTQALSKLRRIAKFYINSVNLEDFDSVTEKKSDMAHGKANPLTGNVDGIGGDTIKNARIAVEGE